MAFLADETSFNPHNTTAMRLTLLLVSSCLYVSASWFDVNMRTCTAWRKWPCTCAILGCTMLDAVKP